MNDLDFLNDYNWREAFQFADGFSISDVSQVFGYSDGENDGENWIIYGRLKDDRFFCLSAGCDYTGWDCRAGGNSFVDNFLDEVIRMGMGENERARFGLYI